MSGILVPLYLEPSLFGDIRWPTAWPKAGFKEGDEFFEYLDPVSEAPLSTSLEDFIDLESTERLSMRASGGLLSRLDRSGKACPLKLRDALTRLAQRA